MPIAWLVAIVAFLYSPYLSKLRHHQKNTLTIFMWADIIQPYIIQQFEEKTGAKVYANYYEGNDELLAKLQFSDGKGYDIIMPTHYLLPSLIERGFLKPIDTHKITCWNDLNFALLEHASARDYQYAIPLMWELYGLGIDATFFKNKPLPTSWHALFKPRGYRVGMTDEPREIIHLASHALFGPIEKLNKKQVLAVKKLLISQKKSVEAYTDLNIGTLLTSGTCPVVLSPSSTVFRCAKDMPQACFVLPKEGSVITLENISISSHSTHEDLAYQFINFVLEPHNVRSMYDYFGYLPTRMSVLKTLDLDYLHVPENSLTQYLKKTRLISLMLPRHDLYALWLAVKAY